MSEKIEREKLRVEQQANDEWARKNERVNKICRRPECQTASGCFYKGNRGECTFPAGGSLDRWPITPWGR